MVNRRLFLAGLAAPVLFRCANAFGQESDFEKLLAALETDNSSFPGASGRVEGKEFDTSSFAAAQPKVGKSARKISGQAIRMITGFEVSGKRRYEAKYRKPIWPKGASGVTIAIGYDLGYTNSGEFEEDWKPYMADGNRQVLTPTLGVKGTPARDLLPGVQTVEVPFDVASQQFIEQTLPKYIALTESALPNTADLSDDAMGALVSLTFNRGASYRVRADEDPTGRYEQMRQIRKLMKDKKFADIPDQFRNMKWIWEGKRDMAGLLTRRDMEADLFEIGLKS
ncbi:glycoside hydrolase family protein [Sinorhizobium saheli]|uniref:glycoside hydrolase family protein n=1 Tax=Sinorhizobium saheli TaxID=36856 RepID=UPI001296D71A|nr:hypothetical protein [Sinorhizobium saheli]MQW85984.1 hypothetical protein [Sinorhizobium saheli]